MGKGGREGWREEEDGLGERGRSWGVRERETYAPVWAALRTVGREPTPPC